MHAHLQPLGGIAGDMFAAALLDAWPELEAGLAAALERAGLTGIVTVARETHNDGVLAGSRFRVTPAREEERDHVHRHYREVVALLGDAAMDEPVRERALDIFRLLGEAEAHVHGVAIDRVTFHEVGAWDSIADVFAAAWLVQASGVTTWSCAPVPLGGGRVRTAHGEMAVPTPATARLLEGFPLHDDGRAGERVTPTGAAILRHLEPAFRAPATPVRLRLTGSGFGTRRLEGTSNVLRVLVFDDVHGGLNREQVAVCSFEVDDQTAEDLAAGLERLRALDPVLDVSQSPAFGKKGRLGTRVQVIARPAAVEQVVAQCLQQTTTLGVRWQVVERASLPRESAPVSAGGSRVRVKQAVRPDGSVTRKAEMDDVAGATASREEREALRHEAETAASAHDHDHPDPHGHRHD